MRITLTVTDLDGRPRTVVAGFKDQIAYEAYAGRTITSWNKDHMPGVRDFAILAWITETGQATPFPAWTDTVEMVVFEGVESTDPTRPGVSPG
jgi:hypothetical protein